MNIFRIASDFIWQKKSKTNIIKIIEEPDGVFSIWLDGDIICNAPDYERGCLIVDALYQYLQIPN